MCNLYSMTKGQDAIRQLAGAMRDMTGNMPSFPSIYPDKPAPIVRNAPDGVRELTLARWGMPTPPAYLNGPVDRGVTNIRNVGSAHWRRWLKPANRCLVPATAFSEYSDTPGPDGRKPLVWFQTGEDAPLFFMAGLWCEWTGARGTQKAPDEGTHTLFGFLTCEPNEVVKLVHKKAMPVILTEQEELEAWMTASWEEAARLQRPLAHDLLLALKNNAPKSVEDGGGT